MTTKSKWLRFAVALVVLMGLVAGCTGNGEIESTEEEPAAEAQVEEKEPVALEVWILDRVGADAMAAASQVIEAWAAETGNTVNITEGNQFEMLNNIPVAIPAGEGPDVFMTVNNYVGGHYLGGLIVPIQDEFTDADSYIPGTLDAFTVDGQLLGVPIAADVNALVYNKAKVSEAPATMQDLVSVSKQLTGGDEYGLLYQVDSFWYSYPFFSAFGGYVFNWTGSGWDTSDIGFDTPEGIAGLQYIRDLVDVEGLMPADVTWEVMDAYFAEGKSAMIITNPSMVPSYKSAGIDVGVAPIPVIDGVGSPKPFATYTGFSVSAYSEHQSEAISLVQYIGANVGKPLYEANSGNIPVYSSVLEDSALASDVELAAWMSQLEVSDPLPNIDEMNYVWTPATTAFLTAVHGETDVATAMAEAQELILTSLAGIE
jgi:arabinogalactan oligomer/maltooligosaccharide transport system substrate-binding protein